MVAICILNNMRKLILIIFIFTFGKCYGQSQYVFDTVKVSYEFKQETNKWDYYNSNGSLAWGNVNGLDTALIPKNGYAQRKYKNTTVNGYIVFRKEISSSWGAKPIYFLDANKKKLEGFFKTIIL